MVHLEIAIRDMIEFCLKIFIIAGFVFPVSAEENLTYYAVEGSNNNVVFGIKSERFEKTITKLSHKGLGNAINALETFFYLSKEKNLKDVIDMHYIDDGSRQYVKELLYDNPDSFSGAKNLSSIKIINRYYVGKHEILQFIIEDKYGSKAMWFEDFVCEEDVCFKSNFLNIFGRGVLKKFFNEFISIKKILSKKPSSDYTKINLDTGYFGAVHPFEVFVNAKKITDKEAVEGWYLKLNKIKEIKKNKSLKLEQYLMSIFEDWEENKTMNSNFNTSSIEKDWVIANLSNVHDFNVKGYLDTHALVWIYASALMYNNEETAFLFAFHKKNKNFLMKNSEIGIGRILMNKSVELALLQPTRKVKNGEQYKYRAKIEEEKLNAFYNKLDSNRSIKNEFIILVFLFICLALGVYLYIKSRSKRNDE